MKFILFISIMIIVQTTIDGHANASCQTNNSVFFEVRLNENMEEIPYLIIENNLIDEPELKLEGELIIQPHACKGNIYFFNLQHIENPSYFSMVIDSKSGRTYILRDYHYEPGDNIEIKVNEDMGTQDYNIDFSGIGSGKYRCVSELQYRLSQCHGEKISVFI